MTSLPKVQHTERRTLLHELFVDNPMLDEAIRARRRFQRGGATAGPGLYYSVIGLIALIYIWSIGAIVHTVTNVTEEISYLELICITLAMPLSVYSTIAGERERATWEALVLTRLSPGQILAGKLTWRIITLLTVMVILSLLIIVGEMMRPEYGLVGTLYGQSLVFSWGILLGAVTLFISARTKRSVAALGIVGITLVASLLLFPLLVSVFGFSANDYGNFANGIDPFNWRSELNYALQANPFIALGSIIHGPPPNYDKAFNVDSGDFDAYQSHFLFLTKSVPIAPVAYIGLAIGFLALAYHALRQLEAPQETERAYRIRFRTEIGPHIVTGIVTAIVFGALTYMFAGGDIGFTAWAAFVGLVLGTFCAWLVSRTRKALLRRKH